MSRSLAAPPERPRRRRACSPSRFASRACAAMKAAGSGRNRWSSASSHRARARGRRRHPQAAPPWRPADPRSIRMCGLHPLDLESDIDMTFKIILKDPRRLDTPGDRLADAAAPPRGRSLLLSGPRVGARRRRAPARATRSSQPKVGAQQAELAAARSRAQREINAWPRAWRAAGPGQPPQRARRAPDPGRPAAGRRVRFRQRRPSADRSRPGARHAAATS